MKPEYVFPLSDQRASLEIGGGKGMSLAKLIRAGLPVPGGFHVTTEAYRQFVTANDLQPKIIAALRIADIVIPASLETASHSIYELLICAGMMASLPHDTWVRLLVWTALGLLIYFFYGFHHSALRRTGR